MPKLNWDGDDFRNPRDSSGSIADNISRSGELQQGYSHGSLTRGLVAYYLMDSGEGSTLEDVVFDNDGTVNGASWSSDSKIGEACLSFDGQNDYVELSDSELFNFGKTGFCIIVWIKTSRGAEQDYITKSEFESNSESRWRLGSNDGTVFMEVDDSTESYAAQIDVNIADDNWHMLTGVRRAGEKLEIWVDGERKDTQSEPGNNIDNSNKVRIGAETDKNYFEGKMDEVRIYDRPLSTPEIKALYEFERPSKVTAEDTLQ